jgi:hypothetical protein
MIRTRGCLLVLALLLPGCAAGLRVPGTLDPAVATTAVEATAPQRPLQVVFAWEAMEGDARFAGQGVARIQPEYRARLDLFGPRGDTYLSAALVDSDLRLPPGVPPVQIPPPPLLWAVLGVVAPPPGATLVGTREQTGRTELYYEVGGGILLYTLEGDTLRSARLEEPGRRRLVELTGSAAHGLPARAVYRDAAAGVELMLNLERADEAESFPPDIWRPGA